MALADYMLCDRCGRKAYYDSDVDYRDSEQVVICGECAETHFIAFSFEPRRRKSPEATDDD